MEKFVLVLSPDESEDPKVGVNEKVEEVGAEIDDQVHAHDEVEINMNGPMNMDIHTVQYVVRYRPSLKLIFELGGIPAFTACVIALCEYDKKYTVPSLDVYNLLNYTICCLKFSERRVVDRVPNDPYIASGSFVIGAGCVQLLITAVCISSFKFMTMGVALYQYLSIQMLLCNQIVDPVET